MGENYSKKIRILSFQNAHNFGAVLQAYGLQQTILSLGYTDVKFINYNPKYLSDRYKPFSWKQLKPARISLKSIVGRIARVPFYFISTLKRNAAFDSSIKRLLIQTDAVKKNECDLSSEEYDVLVCGSDQIWNTALTGSFDPVFLGRGPYKKKGYCVSYAPSTELSSLTDENAKELASLVDDFKYISVRETPIQEKLQKYTNREISVCVDPTILCGTAAYNKIVDSKQVKKEYILVYAYDPFGKSVQDVIKTIPNWETYEVYSVLLGARGVKMFFNKKFLCELSIEKFLSYIKNASFVVTNSFHGLAFSLLFERNFNVVYEPGKQIRCVSLLEQIGLLNRFVKDSQTVLWNQIDYSNVNSQLEKIRNESKQFLTNALKGV